MNTKTDTEVSRYNIQIFHAIPSYDYLKMLGVSNAYPELEMIIYVHERITNKYLYLIKLLLKGHYYCCGSANFEDVDVEYYDHDDAINDVIYNMSDHNKEDISNSNINMKEYKYYHTTNFNHKITDQEITIEDIINDQYFQMAIKKSLRDTIMNGYGNYIIEFIYDYLC